jgi:hypothetical protein
MYNSTKNSVLQTGNYLGNGTPGNRAKCCCYMTICFSMYIGDVAIQKDDRTEYCKYFYHLKLWWSGRVCCKITQKELNTVVSGIKVCHWHPLHTLSHSKQISGWSKKDTHNVCVCVCVYIYKTKLRGLSPRANYTDRAAAAGRRS